MEKEEWFSKDDKVCPHCGGEIAGHSCGERIVYWCNNCGANNKKKAPSVSLEFSD